MGRIDTGLIFCNPTLYQRGGHIVRFWHQNLPLGCDDFKHHTHRVTLIKQEMSNIMRYIKYQSKLHVLLVLVFVLITYLNNPDDVDEKFF